MRAGCSLLIVGLGDRELGDSGLGAAAVSRLTRRTRLPPGVEAVTGDLSARELIDQVRRARCVVIVDAVGAELDPGTLLHFAGSAARRPLEKCFRRHRMELDLSDPSFTSKVILLGLVPDPVPAAGAWRSLPV